MQSEVTTTQQYEPPALRVLGSVAEITQGCRKRSGGSDGFIFQGSHLVCSSG